jgi:hypothetical protein
VVERLNDRRENHIGATDNNLGCGETSKSALGWLIGV